MHSMSVLCSADIGTIFDISDGFTFNAEYNEWGFYFPKAKKSIHFDNSLSSNLARCDLFILIK